MRCQIVWRTAASFLLLFAMVGSGASANVRAQESPGPRATEQAFFTGFESEPPGMTPSSFSLTLAGQQFDFIFTLEGDSYAGHGLSHVLGFGENDSESVSLTSGVRNISTIERVIIVRNDGGDFVLNSLFVNNREGTTVTVAGFDNGVQIGAGQTVANGAAATLNFAGIVVDEVRLTAGHFEDTHIDSFAGDSTATKDYGDLPQSYVLTSDADNGASHALGAVYLGNCVDADADGQPSPNADGDDTDGEGATTGACATPNADEDGVAPVGDWDEGAGGGSLEVVVTGGEGCLSGWIDWDGDSSLSESSDHVLDMAPVTGGLNTVAIDVPTGAFSGNDTEVSFFARFRLIADAGEAGSCADDLALQVAGPAGDGEVEDYLWSFSPTAVQIGAFRASSQLGLERTFAILVSFVPLLVLGAMTLRRLIANTGRHGVQ